MFEPPVSTPIGANDREARVPHGLVFLVGQRLHGSDGDRVAGVHAHGIEIFDRTNDDAVVGAVPHDFHFKLLPAEQGFLDQDLANRREVEAAPDDFLELLAVVGDTAARAAEGERRSDDERKSADRFRNLASLVKGLRDAGTCAVEADLEHDILEESGGLRRGESPRHWLR